MILLHELSGYIDDLLNVAAFSDYAPNGLQVAGRQQINKIVSGVTASQALIDAALAAGADAIIVHHGYFWRGEDPCLIGIKRRRIHSLLAADVSLLAYHLPLDAHDELGNNVQLAKVLGIEIEPPAAVNSASSMVRYGRFTPALSSAELGQRIHTVLGRQPLHIAGKGESLSRVAWCTGAAQNYFEQAIRQQIDVYISGEISEQSTHLARESGVHFFAAGHHATERYGVKRLGQHLAETHGLDHEFIDIDNPV